MGKISFEGRTVLITGASFGIGKALSAQFASRGAHLALGSLPEEGQVLQEWAEELSAQYHIRTWTFPIDLLSENGPERLYQDVKETVGDVFALVNNAGTVAYGRFWETSWEHQFKTYQINLTVPMRIMYLFLPDMVKRGEGIIFNTSSVSALQPTPFQSVYGASKAGLQSLSQGIRAELKGTGVTVCTLNPPYIDTRLLTTEGYPPDLRFYTLSGKKSPEWLAKKAIEAFEHGKMLYVPGFSAKLFHLYLIRISPRFLVDAVSRFFLQGWRSSQRKAL
ncbi:MAG: SDR family NAD(P)-dependent oxidoreductase [Desulfomonilia bacterium]